MAISWTKCCDSTIDHGLVQADSVWVHWNTVYNLRAETIWTADHKSHHSESWRAILKVRDILVQLAGGTTDAQALITSCVVGGCFQVNKMYDILRPKYAKVRWDKILWDSTVFPKHGFISSLAAQAKLPTVDCLARRGLPLVNCILHWLNIRGRTVNFWTELEWCRSRKTRKHWNMSLIRCCLAATVYMIWQERNMRIFRDHITDGGIILRQLKYVISAKIFFKYEKYSDEIVDVLSYSS
ncbi:uncharacterized protein LOC141639640 [Silene latifolia]|uniref:uncharacterized protein LOC141639640 n=1 Tax=Silene latifolia TaxID=37657 RepID=UPI003D77252B